MQLARVVGTVVATQKHKAFTGAKLLLVQPVGLDDTPRGTALLAVDSVGAGVHEKVLIVMEGRAAGEALGRKGAPVDAAIVGIVDSVDVQERTNPSSDSSNPTTGPIHRRRPQTRRRSIAASRQPRDVRVTSG